jgi:hypothetical protein
MDKFPTSLVASALFGAFTVAVAAQGTPAKANGAEQISGLPVRSGQVLAGATFAQQALAKGDADKRAEQKTDQGEMNRNEPPKDKAFAEVAKDAKVIKGLFTLYQTEEKTYIEIQPEQLDKMYMLSLTCETGLGERGFYAADVCGETPFVFHQQGKNVQMMAKNTRFVAQANSPMERAVAHSFSDSILGATKLESLPHPERKSLLVDLGAIFLTDLPMMGYGLEETFRIPYRFDPKNSYFGTLKAFEQNDEIEAVAHFHGMRALPHSSIINGMARGPGEAPPTYALSAKWEETMWQSGSFLFGGLSASGSF